MASAAKSESLSFQAEVGRLLDLMIHSVYSNKEIFLRELISNAADACDRLRYEAISHPDLMGEGDDLSVNVRIDRQVRTLTVSDAGIGMNRDDLVENLGTIARSGTAAFVDRLTGDARRDVQLIGQFGVGFYSAFMVADRVRVVSRRAGEDRTWAWESDGRGGFTIEELDDGRDHRGTDVILHLREGEDEFLEKQRITGIVRTYSDHVAVPVKLIEGAGEAETVNRASALWTRPRSEVDEEQYKEFYRHVSHGLDEPWLTMHWRAEGMIEYSALLFVPSTKPFDLFDPERKNRVRLYVRRVFITDDAEELLPGWLRFLRGVIDSEDLPLNVSREMLQSNAVVRRIRSGITQRVLTDLGRKAKDDPEGYTRFWQNFGAVLKEGLYEDAGQRDALMPLVRCRTTRSEGELIDLPTYLSRMVEGQEAIYTISGDDADALARSPQLEGFAARGIEVILLDDPVDEFWVPAVGSYEGKPFRSVTRAGSDLDRIAPRDSGGDVDESVKSDVDGLVAQFKLALGDAVKDVRSSARLTDSPVCLVADEGDMDLHLERLLKQHGQRGLHSPRILELNPRHPFVQGLARMLKGPDASDLAKEYALLMLDQARVVEGEPLPDPSAYSRRLASLLERGLPAG